MDSDAIIREFGRRYAAFRWSMAIVLLTFAVAGLSIVALPAPWPTVIGFTGMALMLPFAVVSFRYRCPACGASPVDDEGDQTIKAPPTCRNCGVRLRARRH